MSRAKRKRRGHGLTSASRERRKLERDRPQGVQTAIEAQLGEDTARLIAHAAALAPYLRSLGWPRAWARSPAELLISAATVWCWQQAQRGRGNVTQLPPWFASLTNDTSRRSPGLGLRVECRRGDLDTEEIPPPPQWFCGAEPAEDQPASDIPSPAVVGDTKACMEQTHTPLISG